MNERTVERTEVFALSAKELQLTVIALIFFLFFVFLGGYFLGKKRAYEEIAHKYNDECFADKINQSIFSLYEQDSGSELAGEAEELDTEIEAEEEAAFSNEPQENSQVIKELAYAQLCGFGTQHMASLYVDSLKRRHIGSKVIERKSYSKKGKLIHWYQVVTDIQDKKELQVLLEQLKLDDKLADVIIIDVPSE